jgi:hypothetical protein
MSMTTTESAAMTAVTEGMSWSAAYPATSPRFPAREKSLSWMGEPLMFSLHRLA